MNTDTVGLYVNSVGMASNFTVKKDVRSCTENKYDAVQDTGTSSAVSTHF